MLPLRAPTIVALVLVLIGQALKPGGNLLLGLNQNVQQIFGYVAVFVVKERRGQTCTKRSDYTVKRLYTNKEQIFFKNQFIPRLPTRPVRPIRWTYSSMSLGKSKLITCFTLLMSRPLAATCKGQWKKKSLTLSICKNATCYISHSYWPLVAKFVGSVCATVPSPTLKIKNLSEYLQL